MGARAQIIITASIFCFVFAPQSLHAISVFNASDIMSSQKIGEPSNHTISFRSFSGVNSGAIVLNFSNAVSSMGLLDYSDIDLSYGPTTGAENSAALAPQVLSSSLIAQAGAWRVFVNNIAKTITLAFPTVGGVPIRSSDRVKIKIGSHATSQAQGNAQMVNALLQASSIVIDIIAGPDDGKIAVVLLADNSVGVSASQPIPLRSRSGAIVGAILPQGSAAAQKSASVNESRDINLPLPETFVPISKKKEEKIIRSDVPINGTKQKKDIPAAQEQKLADRNSVQTGAPPTVAVEKVPVQKQELPMPPFVAQDTIQEQGRVATPLLPEIAKEQKVQEFQPIVIELAEPAVAVLAPEEQSATVSVKNSDGSGLTLNIAQSNIGEQTSVSGIVSAPVVFSVQPLAPQAAVELVPDIVIETDTSSIVGGIVYQVSAEQEDGAQTQFDGARTMVFFYTNEQVMGLDEQSLKAYFWNPFAEQWTPEETSVVDTEKNSVTIQTTHFSLYALRAEKKPEAEQHVSHIQVAQSKKTIREQRKRLELGDVYLLDERGNIIQQVDDVFSSSQALYLRSCVNREKITHKPRAVKISFNGAYSVLSYNEESGCSDAFPAPRVLGVYPFTIKIIYFGTDAVDVVRARIAAGDSAKQAAERELFITRERQRKQKTAAAATAVVIASATALYVLVPRRRK